MHSSQFPVKNIKPRKQADAEDKVIKEPRKAGGKDEQTGQGADGGTHKVLVEPVEHSLRNAALEEEEGAE